MEEINESNKFEELLIGRSGYIAIGKDWMACVPHEELIYISTLIDLHKWRQSEGKLKSGYFLCTVEFLIHKTNLTHYNEKRITASFKKRGIISTERRGTQGLRYIKLNYEELKKYMHFLSGNNFEIKTEKDDSKKIKINDKIKNNLHGNDQINEITVKNNGRLNYSMVELPE